MAVLASDLFDRADNADLGALWDLVGTNSPVKISGNRAAPSLTDGSLCSESYNNVVWPDNQYSEVVLGNPNTAAAGAGPAVRCGTAIRTEYYLTCASEFSLFSIVAGSFTLLATYAVQAVLGDIVRLEADGAMIRGIINGVERISVVDADIPSGRAGIVAETLVAGQNEIAEWNGGNLTPEGTGAFYYQSRSNVPPQVRMG